MWGLGLKSRPRAVDPWRVLEIHPDTVYGGLPLTDEQRLAYLEYHRARNAANLAASRRLGLRARRVSGLHAHAPRDTEPNRRQVFGYFGWAYKRLAHRFAAAGDGAVTILDLGCGAGTLARVLAEAGARGRYIGVDLVPRSSWSRLDRVGGLSVEFIEADAHTVNLDGLGGIDLLVSELSLQEFTHDAEVLRRFDALLTEPGVHLHAVPAPGALAAFGPSGYRQYTPLCLSRLLPYATLHSVGGPAGRWFGRFEAPLWGAASRAAETMDRRVWSWAPTVYGVCGVDLEDLCHLGPGVGGRAEPDERAA